MAETRGTVTLAEPPPPDGDPSAPPDAPKRGFKLPTASTVLFLVLVFVIVCAFIGISAAIA